jgi:hypothetical protein
VPGREKPCAHCWETDPVRAGCRCSSRPFIEVIHEDGRGQLCLVLAVSATNPDDDADPEVE